MKLKSGSSPTTLDAYQLLHQGALVLSQVESNGIRVDTDYLNKAIREVQSKIGQLEAELKTDEVYRAWRKRFGDKTKIGSREQLAIILFDVLKLGEAEYTLRSQGKDVVKKRYRSDEEILAKVKHPFVGKYLRLSKLQKARGTYLEGIRRELVEGFIHPVFNLHLVQTYRSSSSDPNFQNLPIRDPEQGEMIRRCFIPRPGHLLVEMDFSGIEVRVAACYNKDPNLIKYVTDPTTDMHRDTAMELFLLDKEQVDKRTTRDWAKNRFVFPEFYGSVYFQCAPHLWQGVLEQHGRVSKKPSAATNPTSMSDPPVSIKRHLKSKGVKELGDCDPKAEAGPGTFVHHVRQVEKRFWGERFPAYQEWKRRWYDAYLKTGSFEMLTGFRCTGFHGRNDVINYPVQGSASHCKLWSLIRIQRWLNKHNMKSRIVGEIHDSILADVWKSEVQDYLTMAKRIMTVSLPKAWPWIIVPLDVEAEASAENWHLKKQWVESDDGKWTQKPI